MFTIKSDSNEGTYFLVKNWEKQRAFWKLGSDITLNGMYKTKAAAKGALIKLLKVMPEYKTDSFTMIEVTPDHIVVNTETLEVA